MTPRELLVALHRAALDAVHGGRAVEASLRERPPRAGPVHLLACGKAACAMADGARRALGARIVAGEVTTKDGHGFALSGWTVREAAHPVPDERSVAAAEAALRLAAAVPADATLLVLISGGASSLWCAPVAGVTLADKRRETESLLRGGADIEAINARRRALSRIKGGGLLRAAGSANVLTLAVSDVAGDPPGTIGSGPTVPADGAAPGAFRVVASLDGALDAARAAAESRGLRVHCAGRTLSGEARELAASLPARARHARAAGFDLWLAGGEPTVTVRGTGRGGRCQEMALAFALARDDADREVTALFAGTDGSDGPTDAAGGFCDAGTLERVRAAGVDPAQALAANDAHTALAAAGDLFRTGPTHTNVNDLALLLLRGL